MKAFLPFCRKNYSLKPAPPFFRFGAGFVVFWLLSVPLFAQTSQLNGRFVDKNKAVLVGVPVILSLEADTTQRQYALTDTSGRFSFPSLAPGAYRLRATYLGFNDFSRSVNVQNAVEELGDLVLEDNARNLREVTIVGQTPGAQQKGDTIQFNANAYKVTRDASSEDLIRKMPGITMENGQVKSQGENVQRVLVDGKPFFGDDPSIALRNLPAEVVDKIEVFDRLSEQSQFTGFNDGNTTKTINIVTRRDRQQGVFGRVFAGYGTSDSYSTGGNINYFKGPRRISLIGLSNNINQQNFSAQDLQGVGGGGGGGFRGGGGGRGGQGGGGGGGGAFQTGQQPGISRTNSVGLNFTDDWGKLTVRGSYFFNNNRNRNSTFDYREYFLPGNNSQYYRENTRSGSEGFNHRLDLRLEYAISDRTSLLLIPSLRLQRNDSDNEVAGQTTRPDSSLLNRSQSRYDGRSMGYNFNNELLLRHRFTKPGRTISLSLNTSLSDRDATNLQFSLNEFFNDSLRTQRIQQRTRNQNPTYQFSGNIAYTEPLSKTSQLQLTFNSSYRYSDSDRDVRQFDAEVGDYIIPNLLLSNHFKNDYYTNRAGVGYNLRTQKMGLNANVEYQRADLASEQIYPRRNNVDATFSNVLPSANFDYRFTNESRIRLFYRTNTQAPSVTQLQNVIDNSNPLFLTAGNPDLKQSYNHNLTARYSLTKPQKSQSLFLLLGGSATSNYIGNSTLISDGTARLPNDSLIGRGVQLSRPVNLDGFYNLRSFATYSLPLKFMKSSLSVNAGYSISRTPSQINNRINYSRGATFTQGVTLSSNISTKLDFSASYFRNYNLVKNTVQPQLNNRYFFQTLSGRINWIFGPGFVFQSDISDQQYKSFEGNFNQRYTLWNAAVGKKFLKDQRGDLRLSVFDLLGQNRAISQNLTDTYFQTTQSLVLQRYFMLTFTYTIRQFKGAAASNQNGENNQNEENQRGRFRGNFPGGGAPGGGGGFPRGERPGGN
ncbi:outer membrane beta-barrel protein [Tellurirhabdus rosea]|uniref:outer membrane beta-barrel protein n=1 Tax=Tellurirhabdus rosea TaxID=2674997 RepID=UPI00225B0ABF|nr:TonB-dependent receptor [Tellurirhabdus rosea]